MTAQCNVSTGEPPLHSVNPPINTPYLPYQHTYQHTITTAQCNVSTGEPPLHSVNPPTLLTHPLTHPINTSCQHTLSTHLINTSCQHALSTYHPIILHLILSSFTSHYLSDTTTLWHDHRLGDDPGPLRFQYGAEGAKLAQVMCVIFVVGLLVLASTSVDFFYGLIVVLVLGVGTFVGRCNNQKDSLHNNNTITTNINTTTNITTTIVLFLTFFTTHSLNT